jgi:protein-disulfide isomerase
MIGRMLVEAEASRRGLALDELTRIEVAKRTPPVTPAEAAACARDQGRYWEMHDWLFANQQKPDPAEMKANAVTLGLDVGKFSRCLDGGTFTAEIERERREGERVGVAGNPATFINGRLIPGAMAYDEYASEVDDELRQNSRQHSAVGSAR